MASLHDADERRLLWPDADRLIRSILLAPSIEICEALLRGESVPVERLDLAWVRRFGLLATVA